ncbi:phosphoglucomutase/phosphomannomutase PgmG [Sphingomonas montana]|uniref:phosphoglucomutase/phosphomannomutase PgmG n=1 Tax=Sphingomonas montana TaxID=1843236 RepID=UPI00096F1A0F|nr:phosphomannomutase/phosphoglucomutase [Sphingomonas montana]
MTPRPPTHRFAPSILREYDIRGIVGDTLHAADAVAVGRGFGTVVARDGGTRIAVGRDGRTHSPMLEDALVAGLLASGCDVVRIGVGPTPMLYFAETVLGVDAAVMVTGSHNPASHNGFKLVLRHRPFFADDIQALGALASTGDWTSGAGTATDIDIADRYVDRLLAGADTSTFRIGWDAGNGAAGAIVESLAARLPGTHRLLFTAIDGTFPNHHPDPTIDANLDALRTLILSERLDFGVAFDGDGDRIGVIDACGRTLPADRLLAILAEPLLADHPGATVIGDVKMSQTLFDRVAELGGVPVMGRAGHAPMKQRMRETGALLAGEQSGHIFFADDHPGYDDALYAALRLIRTLGRARRPLADLVDALPVRVATPELRFASPEDRKFVVVAEVAARLAATGAAVDTTDGVRVTTPDGWWLLRASNTQDLLVARAEGRDQPGCDRLVAELNRQLAASGASPAT